MRNLRRFRNLLRCACVYRCVPTTGNVARPADERETMRYDIRQNPTACAAREETRYSLTGAAIIRIARRRADYACSTNGRTLLAVPVELEPGDEVGKVYPSNAFADAQKMAKASKAPEVSIACNGVAKLPNGATYAPTGDRFPDVESVIPSFGDASSVVELGINAALLAELCAGLGSDMVTLRIQLDPRKAGQPFETSTPILIEPMPIDTRSKAAQKRGPFVPLKGFGVIMPIGGAS